MKTRIASAWTLFQACEKGVAALDGSGDPERDRGLRDLQAAYSYLSLAPQRESRENRFNRLVYGRRLVQSKLAEDQPKLAACIVNYGSLPSDRRSLQRFMLPFRATSARMTGAFRQRMCAPLNPP